jgi:hypothetical protein
MRHKYIFLFFLIPKWKYLWGNLIKFLFFKPSKFKANISILIRRD